MKNTIIVTVFNEQKTIVSLIESILNQTKIPDEVVIADGGSTDNTLQVIRDRVAKIKRIKFKVFKKKGNRSIGRNEAIRRSYGTLVAITDAGCTLDKNWLKNILKPFDEGSVDVVAGYYKARVHSLFQKCLVPYVLIMPDKVNPHNFLPATRSMAIRRSVFNKLGGFNEKLSNNEDYAFARKIRAKGFNITFAKSAIVYWIPRTNLIQAFKMFFRFALGDTESGILRPKVIFIFARYIFAAYLLFINYYLLFSLVLVYLAWAIMKNYRYVKDRSAFVVLPTLQIISDLAVMSGTIVGFSRL